MESLPDELVLHLFTFLEPTVIVRLQLVSKRLFSLARDNDLWKGECFVHSRAESKRLRETRLLNQGANLVALRQAMTTLPRSAVAPFDQPGHPDLDAKNTGEFARKRAWASWDPSFPSEKLDFYREYIHRHADLHHTWIHDTTETRVKSKKQLEAIGMGVFPEEDKIIAPMEDGSVCIWDIHPTNPSERGFVRSRPGLVPFGPLSQQSVWETTAIETISVNSTMKRVYIASHSQLHEIDLQTLQTCGRVEFPAPITALSESKDSTPMTVGTTTSLHQFDFRAQTWPTAFDISLSCELIAGTPPNDAFSRAFWSRRTGSTVTLPQPGPSSILHLPSYPGSQEAGNSIWVAGRFTSLLNYDRRYWPRICASTFSGARLSSLCALPFPHIPREYDLTRNHQRTPRDLQTVKSAAGFTLVGAGEYKGRGSLELYGIAASNAGTEPPHQQQAQPLSTGYQNRQTSARSRLLSVSAHGASLVFSDGDGNLKWTERDGSTEVRLYNINDDGDEAAATATSRQSAVFHHRHDNGDIVKKIVNVPGSRTDDLLVWTADGRVGMVEFGRRTRSALEAGAEAARELATEREERIFGESMRRALEVHADETRFMRGLGFY